MQKLLTGIGQTIFDKKGFNILILDVKGISTMTDYFVIAEGTVDRHVRAISSSLVDYLTEQGWHPLHIEGERDGEWVVLDYMDVVIHLFTPELREKYALEKLWKAGKVVDVDLVIPKPSAGGRYE